MTISEERIKELWRENRYDPEDFARAIEAEAQRVPSEPVTVLPDGSAFAVVSFPLPSDHWLYAEREYALDAVEPTDLPAPILTHALRAEIVAAMRYAIRAATDCGKISDFDPDALVQNAVYAMCGPYGSAVAAAPVQQESKCSDHTDAPHGFDRNASHNAGRYVCECDGWVPTEPAGPEDQAIYDAMAANYKQEAKPVAYMAGGYRQYIDGTADHVPLGVEVSLINMGWKNQIPLYLAPPAEAAIRNKALDDAANSVYEAMRGGRRVAAKVAGYIRAMKE